MRPPTNQPDMPFHPGACVPGRKRTHEVTRRGVRVRAVAKRNSGAGKEDLGAGGGGRRTTRQTGREGRPR